MYKIFPFWYFDDGGIESQNIKVGRKFPVSSTFLFYKPEKWGLGRINYLSIKEKAKTKTH